eukprot:1032082-Rhodomonas_salina.1
MLRHARRPFNPNPIPLQIPLHVEKGQLCAHFLQKKPRCLLAGKNASYAIDVHFEGDKLAAKTFQRLIHAFLPPALPGGDTEQHVMYVCVKQPLAQIPGNTQPHHDLFRRPDPTKDFKWKARSKKLVHLVSTRHTKYPGTSCCCWSLSETTLRGETARGWRREIAVLRYGVEGVWSGWTPNHAQTEMPKLEECFAEKPGDSSREPWRQRR